MTVILDPATKAGALELTPATLTANTELSQLGLDEAKRSELTGQINVYSRLNDLPRRLKQITTKGYLAISNIDLQQDECDGTPGPEDDYIGYRVVIEKTPKTFLGYKYNTKRRLRYEAYGVQQYDRLMPPDIIAAFTDAKATNLFDRFEIWEIDKDPYLIGVISEVKSRYDGDHFFLIGSWDEISFTP